MPSSPPLTRAWQHAREDFLYSFKKGCRPLAWLKRWSIKQKWGSLLFFISFVITGLLAFVGSADVPPSRAQTVTLAILAITAQAGSVWAFSGHGKADPAHANRSSARLIQLAVRTHAAGAAAQAAFESADGAAKLRTSLGIVSTEFNWIEDGLTQSVLDWQAFHPNAAQLEEGELD